jgi:uncharacterized protein YbjT (DUF2867 family)
LLDPVSVQRALQGVDKLYLLNAVVPDELTQGLIAFDLAKRAKLKQIVYHSVFKAQAFKDVPHFDSKLAIENALHEFDLPFTIIRLSYFYQNDAALRDTIVKTGVYPVPLGTAGISGVDVRDIAEAAAIALTGDGHLGKTYNLVGPDILTGDKVASIWSEMLGKRVRYGGHDMDAYEQDIRKTSPSWSAFDLRMMYQGYLARLGLRGGEVLAMTLDDLDWERGEILIRGKGQRLERLPLPKQVGTALVHYLRRVRPTCSTRKVFIRLKAPRRGLRLTAICCVVRRALLRAGLNPDFKGAHLLRHSLATKMLRRGASLGEIGQLLRHRQPSTTQIYAKVDIKALRAIALPWMGGAS